MKAHVIKPEKRTVLTYGLPAAQQQELAKRLAAENVSCRAVQGGQTTATLLQLLADETVPVQKQAPQPAGKFAVLDGFEGEAAGKAAAIINGVCPGVIKAVRTAHNSGWRFYALCEELAAEHAAMTKGEN